MQTDVQQLQAARQAAEQSVAQQLQASRTAHASELARLREQLFASTAPQVPPPAGLGRASAPWACGNLQLQLKDPQCQVLHQPAWGCVLLPATDVTQQAAGPAVLTLLLCSLRRRPPGGSCKTCQRSVHRTPPKGAG